MAKNTQQPVATGIQPMSKPPYWRRPVTMIFTIISILLMALFSYHSFASYSSILPFSAPSQESDLSDSTSEGFASSALEHQGQPCPLPTTRYSIHTGQAACYPSSGGIWVSELDALELQYLDIDRFSSTERPDVPKEEEDAFCHKLRLFGGGWYNPNHEGRDLDVGGQCHALDEFDPIVSTVRKIGVPSDENDEGVWVLDVDEDTGIFPDGIIAVRNALSMDERVQALVKLGAVYCADVKECRLLVDLQLEPWEIARGN
ncbi:hypothetical protein EDB81DRAFT_807478 [Dactylonectria macrodidyma]|uniref:Uncharacterized protein n=1 Tax=Dactylonectria macrodidyma TaxID=307937 RepID=A0A9P9E8H2_9HYPO|nr:hypothetical protein EDB81DRAFT_807478 [Dactylonectria macrodidyma]